MTSPISSVSVNPVTGPSTANGAAAARARRLEPVDEATFSKAVGDALSSLSQAERAVADAAERAAVGDLESVSDYMIAATEAQLATEITVAVRDRAISAFNDIMRMQV
jgi:flagellar hook-basal body complex protein FliE